MSRDRLCSDQYSRLETFEHYMHRLSQILRTLDEEESKNEIA